MRRYALGRLGIDAERFGKMMTGDFLDAMAGHSEGESERMKSLAELVRTSTMILWNTQIVEEKRITDPSELWKFSWEKEDEKTAEAPENSEERDAFIERQKKYLEGR